MVGVDIADEMIRQARAASKDFDNIMFVQGSATQIPWEENFFDKVLSVESFYYYPDQDRALGELFRVMAPHGRLFILINLYKDNPYSSTVGPEAEGAGAGARGRGICRAAQGPCF